jgi:hypothetical protein
MIMENVEFAQRSPIANLQTHVHLMNANVEKFSTLRPMFANLIAPQFYVKLLLSVLMVIAMSRLLFHVVKVNAKRSAVSF